LHNDLRKKPLIIIEVKEMLDKLLLSRLLRGVGKAILRIFIVVGCILVLDLIGLGVYGFLTGNNAFAVLSLILLSESLILLFFAVAGTTVIPQSRVIGVPWSISVRAASEEIRNDRQRQISFWVLIGIAGFILFTLALALTSM
jgi:hypothetical protein